VTDRPAVPRLAPLTRDEQDEQAAALLAGLASPDGDVLNIFATLVRHPGLFRRWLPFGGKLMAGRLPPRDRELAVLRTGWRCRAEYEWGQHVLIARSVGVTDDEIARVKVGPETPGWDPFDAALLRAADELHDDACLSDATWQVLAGRYDERQLIELLLLIGQYHLVSFALNSLGVPREPGVPGFDG